MGIRLLDLQAQRDRQERAARLVARAPQEVRELVEARVPAVRPAPPDLPGEPELPEGPAPVAQPEPLGWRARLFSTLQIFRSQRA